MLGSFNRQSLVRFAIALVIGAGSGLALYLWRGYFPRIALISGFSITVLAYMAIQTAERLWRLFRRKPSV